MTRTLLGITLATIAGCAIVTAAALSQPHFKADSIPDPFCGLILLPGQLLATVFHDRGTASPDVALLGAAIWSLGEALIPKEKPTIEP